MLKKIQILWNCMKRSSQQTHFIVQRIVQHRVPKTQTKTDKGIVLYNVTLVKVKVTYTNSTSVIV